MRRRKITKRSSRKKLPFLALLLPLLAAAIFTLVSVETKLAPMIETVAENEVNRLASVVIYEAINEVLQEENLGYDGFITLEKNDTGMITAIRTNTEKSNLLSSSVGMKIAKKITAIEGREIKIPLGNLMENKIFLGRGPQIPVHISPYGNVKTNIKSSFTSAGINQTKHEIILEVSINIQILMPGKSVRTTVKTNLPIAETILVGTVPSTNVQNASVPEYALFKDSAS